MQTKFNKGVFTFLPALIQAEIYEVFVTSTAHPNIYPQVQHYGYSRQMQPQSLNRLWLHYAIILFGM